MIIETLMCTALIAKQFYHIDKSIAYDREAMEKLTEAFKMNEESSQLLKNKETYCDKRLINLAKKKKAVIEFSIPKFIKVYEKIQKIEQNKKGEQLIAFNFSNNEKCIDFFEIKRLTEKNYTNKQLVSSWIFWGLGKTIERESKRNLLLSNNVLCNATINMEQAKSICAIYDAITTRADRLSDLIVKMNALFLMSINQTEKTIKTKGVIFSNYNKFDKEVLKTCANMVLAIIDILNIPIVDEEDELYQQSLELIAKGEWAMQQFEKILYIKNK